MMKHFMTRASGVGLAFLALGCGQAFAQTAASHAEKPAPESSLTVMLHHGETSSHEQVMYQCGDVSKKDDQGVKDLLKSLPDGGRFSVSYLNADMTALAVLPVDGNVLAMANVIAGSGAKYVADRYEWFTKGEEATFLRTDHEETFVTCHVVPEAEMHSKGAEHHKADPNKAADDHKETASAHQGVEAPAPAAPSAEHKDNNASSTAAKPQEAPKNPASSH